MDTSHVVYVTQIEDGSYIAASAEPLFCVGATSEQEVKAKAMRAVAFFEQTRGSAAVPRPRETRVVTPVYERELSVPDPSDRGDMEKWVVRVDHLTDDQLAFYGWGVSSMGKSLLSTSMSGVAKPQVVSNTPPRYLMLEDFNDAMSLNPNGFVIKGPPVE